MPLIAALIYALIYCVVVMIVAWIVIVLLQTFLPNFPAKISQLIWIIAGLVCLLIILGLLVPAIGHPPYPLR